MNKTKKLIFIIEILLSLIIIVVVLKLYIFKQPNNVDNASLKINDNKEKNVEKDSLKKKEEVSTYKAIFNEFKKQNDKVKYVLLAEGKKYPILQAEDSSYLDKNLDDTPSDYGSPYFLKNNDLDKDNNLIVYSNIFSDEPESMFGYFYNFENPDKWADADNNLAVLISENTHYILEPIFLIIDANSNPLRNEMWQGYKQTNIPQDLILKIKNEGYLNRYTTKLRLTKNTPLEKLLTIICSEDKSDRNKWVMSYSIHPNN